MQAGFVRLVVLAGTIMMAGPAAVAGEMQDGSFGELARVVRPQSYVIVADRAGNELWCQVETVSDASLVVWLVKRETQPNGVVVSPTEKRTFGPSDVLSVAEADLSGHRGRHLYSSSTAFDNRVRELEPGRRVTVVQMDNGRVTGRVRQVLESSIDIDPGGDRSTRTFSIAHVRELRQRDVLWDGPLYWALVPTTAWALSQLDDDPVPLSLLWPAVGTYALIGLGFDVIRKPAVYYRAPASTVRFSISPVLTSQRRGLRAVLTF